ncbi:hypothetical protein Y032_0031g2394 [Ancylostoma ceylanicum]|uniref:Uncharacterized protein n=1 Tax=Ancylostoma ceylanicum TaxID=53326 RepID=A0A016UQW3_9BILA|nr:hypothetical protein Y032_0031g2394 [Ancylostoma ceylanicum]
MEKKPRSCSVSGNINSGGNGLHKSLVEISLFVKSSDFSASEKPHELIAQPNRCRQRSRLFRICLTQRTVPLPMTTNSNGGTHP